MSRKSVRFPEEADAVKAGAFCPEGLGRPVFPRATNSKPFYRAFTYIRKFDQEGLFGCPPRTFIRYDFKRGQYCCSRTRATQPEMIRYFFMVLQTIRDNVHTNDAMFRVSNEAFVQVMSAFRDLRKWFLKTMTEEEIDEMQGRLMAQIDEIQEERNKFKPEDRRLLTEEEGKMERETSRREQRRAARLTPDQRRALVEMWNAREREYDEFLSAYPSVRSPPRAAIPSSSSSSSSTYRPSPPRASISSSSSSSSTMYRRSPPRAEISSSTMYRHRSPPRAAIPSSSSSTSRHRSPPRAVISSFSSSSSSSSSTSRLRSPPRSPSFRPRRRSHSPSSSYRRRRSHSPRR